MVERQSGVFGKYVGNFIVWIWYVIRRIKVMKYNKANYTGKEIQFYPGDTYKKWGIIEDVDDLGWTIKITDMQEEYNTPYSIGDKIFISHSKPFSFKFLED